MQKTFKGMTANEILSLPCVITGERRFVTIDNCEYSAVYHDRVELNNGNIASTLVLESLDNRVVLSV